MTEEEDDPYFDPRLRWSKANGENLSCLTLEKRKFDADVDLLKFMSERPCVMLDIQKKFGWEVRMARGHVQSLRNRGVVFDTKRVDGIHTLVYTVKKRPQRLTFFYPTTLNKYH